MLSSKNYFEENSTCSLIGLRYTEDEGTSEWDKRKIEYTSDFTLPVDFQTLLEGKFVDNLSFLYALHPENINREIKNVIDSAHIFVDKKFLKEKLFKKLKQWFFHPEAFQRFEANKESHGDSAIEIGFIDKLYEMFRLRRFLLEMKQELEGKDGLSSTYGRKEGKIIVEHMIRFQFSYLKNCLRSKSGRNKCAIPKDDQ